MKVVYQTRPVQATLTDPKSGNKVTGYASFRVYAYDANEALPALPTVEATRRRCRRLSELRAQAGEGKPIIATIHPASALRGVLPEKITVPEAALKSLRDDVLLRFAWVWS